MRVTVVNVSKTIEGPDFDAVLAAIGRQATEDFQPQWDVPATLRGTTSNLSRRQVPIEGIHDAIIYVGESSQDPTTGVEGAFGYHATNHKDLPYGFVYLDVCAKYGEEWSCTLSHEVLELLADPSAVLTVAGPDPRRSKRSVRYDLEVCDPTQEDYYTIDGIRVSNFVTPAYFKMGRGSSATNFLELPLKPFGVRPGGYFQYEDSHGTHEVDGQTVAARAGRRRAGRALMKLGRRNTRRAARVFG